MSDGPHRSLPMRREWKKVAQRAWNPAFEPDEVCAAMEAALEQDWSDGVPPRLLRDVQKVLGDEPELFKELKMSQLDSLRTTAAGYGSGRLFVEHVIQLATTGNIRPEIAEEAAVKTLGVLADRCGHQVEEHCCRKASAPHAQRVRARIEEGIASTSLSTLARRLVKREPRSGQAKAAKKQGLDDGVRL
jgi:hypothetical protein